MSTDLTRVVVPSLAHAVIAGRDFAAVDALLGAGVKEVTMACSADAISRACESCREHPLLLIVDARSDSAALDGRAHLSPALFERATVVVWGALNRHAEALFSRARSVIACAGDMSARTMTGVALRHVYA